MQTDKKWLKKPVRLTCLNCGTNVFTAQDESDKSWNLGHRIAITSCCNGPCCCDCEEIIQKCGRTQCPLCGTNGVEIWRKRKDRGWGISPLEGLDEDDVDWGNFRKYRDDSIDFGEFVEKHMPQFSVFLKWLKMKRAQNQSIPILRWYSPNEDWLFYYQIALQENRICLLFRHTLLMTHPHLPRFQFGICSSDFYRNLRRFKRFPMARIISRSKVPFIRMLATRFSTEQRLSKRMMFWILMRIYTRRILEIQADSLELIKKW
jgi:hypothetical protein